MNKRRDGHVHSHYCPHGSNDSFEMYLENAINKGIYEITFTEHMTMPEDIVIEGMESNFLDSVSPSIENMDKYINEVRYYKEKYKDKIKINVGLEVDYLEGYEEFTEKMLNKYGDILEDSTHLLYFKSTPLDKRRTLGQALGQPCFISPQHYLAAQSQHSPLFPYAASKLYSRFH